MADYLLKDHKPSANQGKARLRGLYRIIYSKTISPRLWNAKPACAGSTGLFIQKTIISVYTPPAAMTSRDTADRNNGQCMRTAVVSISYQAISYRLSGHQLSAIRPSAIGYQAISYRLSTISYQAIGYRAIDYRLSGYRLSGYRLSAIGLSTIGYQAIGYRLSAIRLSPISYTCGVPARAPRSDPAPLRRSHWSASPPQPPDCPPVPLRPASLRRTAQLPPLPAHYRSHQRH